jgi:hypothetical protein
MLLSNLSILEHVSIAESTMTACLQAYPKLCEIFCISLFNQGLYKEHEAYYYYTITDIQNQEFSDESRTLHALPFLK